MRTKLEIAKKFRELANDVMKPWSFVHEALGEVDGGHGRLFNNHPVKSPSLEVYDSLNDMAKELENEYKKEQAKPKPCLCCNGTGIVMETNTPCPNHEEK